MDRVLLIIDDIQYSRHVEMTLRKVGFEVEAINNEFNINETLLTYNPDYIICRGNSTRLSVINVGRKLKEGTKFNGKVVLIFPEGLKLSPDDLIQMKMDLLLFEPISTLRLAVHLFSFSNTDFEFIKDKLLKFAITDSQFRTYEQTILKTAGMTFDSEIQYVSSLDHIEKPITQEVKELPAKTAVDDNIAFISGEKIKTDGVIIQEGQELGNIKGLGPSESALPPNEVEKPSVEITAKQVGLPTYIESEGNNYKNEPMFPEPEKLSDEIKAKINKEIGSSEAELSLRIDTYNHAINKVDHNLNLGLKKKQTKKESKKLHKDLIDEGKSDNKSESDLASEKARFANAMFKKSKE